MSKFIELTTADGHEVLINIDNILDAYRGTNGNAIITLGSQGDGEYYYNFLNYTEVVNKIMEATK